MRADRGVEHGVLIWARAIDGITLALWPRAGRGAHGSHAQPSDGPNGVVRRWATAEPANDRLVLADSLTYLEGRASAESWELLPACFSWRRARWLRKQRAKIRAQQPALAIEFGDGERD